MAFLDCCDWRGVAQIYITVRLSTFTALQCNLCMIVFLYESDLQFQWFTIAVPPTQLQLFLYSSSTFVSLLPGKNLRFHILCDWQDNWIPLPHFARKACLSYIMAPAQCLPRQMQCLLFVNYLRWEWFRKVWFKIWHLWGLTHCCWPLWSLFRLILKEWKLMLASREGSLLEQLVSPFPIIKTVLSVLFRLGVTNL